MHMLAYGQVVDSYNEYCRIGENTTFECLQHFVRAIKEVFEPNFFKKPTQVDLEKQLRVNANRG